MLKFAKNQKLMLKVATFKRFSEIAKMNNVDSCN